MLEFKFIEIDYKKLHFIVIIKNYTKLYCKKIVQKGPLVQKDPNF